MALYEVGGLTTGTGSGAAALEIVAGTNSPMSLVELGFFLTAATATTLSLGRPGNTPAGGTSQVATLSSTLGSGGTASLGGFILSGWSTAPTAPSAGNTMRTIQLPANIGNGIIWSWDLDELIIGPTRSNGLVLWNLAANSALRFYIKWRE